MFDGRGPRRAAAAAATLLTLLALAVGVGTASPSASADPFDPSDRVGPRVLRVDAGDAADPPEWTPTGVVDDPAAGAVHDGLAESRRCTGGYAVENSPAGASPGRPSAMCSHGPDEAPAGVDVRDQLAAPSAAEGGRVPCYGDGTSGKRFQAVYAVAADRPDRFDAVAGLIPGYAATADRAYAASAARDGGVRHLRWVTGGGCDLSVLHVVLSATGDDSLGNTRAELVTQGLNRPDRKYVVWADAGTYCGIAYVVGDSRPDASNPANAGPTFARVDTSCWGFAGSVEAHEIAHMLGAVQLGAPNSNGSWHCTDESDRLCYDDGSGATLSYLCDSAQEPLLDCGGDDYFNVAPAAGTWLATHWNLAGSQFLETVEPAGASPAPGALLAAPATAADPAALPPVTGPSTAVTPTILPPATDPPVVVPTDPAPDRTLTRAAPRRVATYWTARLPGRGAARSARTFQVWASAGRLSATVGFAGPGRVRIGVRDEEGRSVASRLRRSGGSLATAVEPGRYTVTVRGRPGARVTLTVTRPVR